METFRVGGVEVTLSRQMVLEKLSTVSPEAVREIGVNVNGVRYPVKQALAAATGLLRGNFTSHEAMRVFRRLSFPMETESVSLAQEMRKATLLTETMEVLCADCGKPFVFRIISPRQIVMEGCACRELKRVTIAPGAMVVSVDGRLGSLRVVK